MNRSASRLLILSLSPLRSDPRVLKQINLFRDKYQVLTCGFGPAPDGVAGHFELDRVLPSWPRDPKRLAARRYRQVYWNIAAVAEASRMLRGQHFDAVLANDANTVPLALSLEPLRGVHADLHEFAPKEHFNKPAWRVLVAPYVRWLCRTYLPAVSSVTTVSEGIAEQYQKDFGVDVGVVTNAAPYAELEPRPTGEKIRLIYSSAGQRYRRIEDIIAAMDGVPEDLELDLIVMPNEPEYVDQLRSQAEPRPNVRFRDPVPYTELVKTISEYDVSISVIPPTNFNLAQALPNKFFEAVQARTALIIGPSPAMQTLLERHGLGAVTEDFTAEGLRAVLQSLTREQIDQWKANADKAADELSSEHQNRAWERAIAALLEPAEA